VNHAYKTIKFGLNGKGMVAWKGKLSGKQVLQVASYVLRLQGTKPASPEAASQQWLRQGINLGADEEPG
jgi:cytochrome c oxidase cbb3-type subunit 3